MELPFIKCHSDPIAMESAIATRHVMAVVVLCLLAIVSTKAVRVLVTIEAPQPAQRVEGVVLDPSGGPIEGMTVSDCSEEWRAVLRSTTTDKRGYFRFSPKSNKTIYYLRFDHTAFNPLQLKLVLERKARNRAITVTAPIGG
jgi:hypothetical protein